MNMTMLAMSPCPPKLALYKVEEFKKQTSKITLSATKRQNQIICPNEEFIIAGKTNLQ